MLEKYVVNKNDNENPGKHHCVHTKRHAEQLGIVDFISLGLCNDCHEALKKAKEYYTDADGCKICCPDCNSD